jgi:3-ketosteroid 9alpha-monooxygenase subunit A
VQDFPYRSMPSGWFQVAWSSELIPGAIRPVQAFGRELIVYRGHSGRVHATDAHCRHLGAHLGYGGCVKDDDVVCPFHHWRWGPDGRNVEIPYSRRGHVETRLGTWEVREIDPFVVVWHDARGAPPSWEPPPLPLPLGQDGYHAVYPDHCFRARVAMQPLLLIENLPDIFHFRYLHGTIRVPTFVDLEVAEDSHVIRSHQRFADPIDLEPPVPPTAGSGDFDVWVWGLGLLLTAIEGMGGLAQSANVIPVDEHCSDFQFSVFVPTSFPSERVGAAVELQFKLAREDFPIWEHLSYQAHPPLVPEEVGPYRAVRKWAKQFFPMG